MNLPAQFVAVRLQPRPDGRTDKIPLGRDGNVIDPHIPANWMDEATARAVPGSNTVGFVLTEVDPYFFIDCDKHFDPATGQWSAEANRVAGMFGGAAFEVSSSGTGYHILGRCDQSAVAGLRNRLNGGFEFYHRARFVAFGPHGWQGDPNTDHTAAVLQFVPAREDGGDITLADGPAPEWTGPTDDDDLIRRMLSSAPSVAVAFGNKAHPRDLWEARKEVLGRAFPSATDDFDRSAADAALMGHLAFWTGRDLARMDRLFRRSALVREKYTKRADYRHSTITGAAKACQRVFSRQTVAPAVAAAPEVRQGRTFAEYLFIPDMIEFFAGCVYVRQAHAVMIPGGELLSPVQFKTFYGGHEFQMQADNSRPSRNAFEAFTENRAHHFPKAEGMCFRPDLPPGEIVDGKVNCFFPLPRSFKPGDPAPFLDFLARLFPDGRDREIILSAAAYINQNPGKRVRWAPVIVGPEGNGKTILMRCVAHGIGEKYTHFPAAGDLGNAFNSYLQNKLFIGVEEIHMEDRRDLMDTLKPLITNDRVEVQPKGVDKYMIDNATNWWFNTNHPDAIIKTKDGRRYSIFFCAQKTFADIVAHGMGGEYFPRLVNWLETGGYDAVTNYLLNFRIADEFNPEIGAHRAPETSTTGEAITASLGRAEQEIMEAVEGEEIGFRGGWVSSFFVTKRVRDNGYKVSPNRLRSMLEALGYRFVTRSPRNLNGEGGTRPSVWIRSDLFREGLTIEDYCKAQGHLQDQPIPVMPFRVVQG